jgi:hypothetical protein
MLKMSSANLMTVAILVGLLFVLSMLPRFLGEGFTTLSPSSVVEKATPIGEYDGKMNPTGELTLGTLKDGNVLTVQPGGSAFAPAVNPQVDPENNQLYHMLRNETSTDAKACLMSGYSSSTGCIVPTKQDLVDHDTRGGNRAMSAYV